MCGLQLSYALAPVMRHHVNNNQTQPSSAWASMQVGSCCAGAAIWQQLATAAPCRATQRPRTCNSVLPGARLAAGPTGQGGPAPGGLACSGPTPWWCERPGTAACRSAPGHPTHALHGRQPAAAHRSHRHSAVHERHSPCSIVAALWAWGCVHGSVLCTPAFL